MKWKDYEVVLAENKIGLLQRERQTKHKSQIWANSGIFWGMTVESF